MKFAYARVSTRKQSRDGNGLDDQITQLKIAGYDELIVEEFTGSTTKRPKFDALIQRLQHGDTIIVTKLDRFARTTAEGSKLISDLLQRGVAVHILNMGLIDNTPTGKLNARKRVRKLLVQKTASVTADHLSTKSAKTSLLTLSSTSTRPTAKLSN